MDLEQRIAALEKHVEELNTQNNFRHLLLGLAALVAMFVGVVLPR
jgi:hypothetical protein